MKRGRLLTLALFWKMALAAFGAAPHDAITAEQVELMIAQLQEISTRFTDQVDTAEIEDTIARLQSHREGKKQSIDVPQARKAYHDFISSPAFEFLDKRERNVLERMLQVLDHGAEIDMDDVDPEIFGWPIPSRKAIWQEAPPMGLRRGDIVLRTEKGFLSRRFVEASKCEKRFSHVGVVLQGRGEVKILTVGGVGVSVADNVASHAWRDYLINSVDCAVYRLEGAVDIGDKIAAAAERRLGIPFDAAFDLKTKDRLYCAEMVRDAVNEAAGREVVGTTWRGDFEYVAIDDCYRNGFIKIFDAKDCRRQDDGVRK